MWIVQRIHDNFLNRGSASTPWQELLCPLTSCLGKSTLKWLCPLWFQRMDSPLDYTCTLSFKPTTSSSHIHLHIMNALFIFYSTSFFLVKFTCIHFFFFFCKVIQIESFINSRIQNFSQIEKGWYYLIQAHWHPILLVIRTSEGETFSESGDTISCKDTNE